MSIETLDWWPELVALKDKLSLRELAVRFGASAGAISAGLRRKNTGRRPSPHVDNDQHRFEPEAAAAANGRGDDRQAATTAPPRARRSSRIEPFTELLGVESDAAIAQKAGVTRAAVTAWRLRRAIGSSHRNGPPMFALEPFAPPTIAAPRRQATVEVGGYKVLATAGGVQGEFYVLGEDIAAACQRAEAALGARSDGPWSLDAITWLAEGLR